MAYCAQKEGKWRWVIDEVEGPPFTKLTPTSFTFSEDGKRHAYVAIPGFGRDVLVVDGKIVAGGELGKPIPFDGAPVFSLDGSRLAYAERSNATPKRKMRIVLDGKPGSWNLGIGARISSGFGAFGRNTADGSPRARPTVPGMDFSADSKHFAYSEFVENGSRQLIDGVSGPVYKKLGIDFAFAPDGSDHAYIGYPDGQRTILRKTAEPLPIEMIRDGTLTFSPDGKRLAFGGTRDGMTAAWLDGKAIPMGIEVRDYHTEAIRFSPDSQRIACFMSGAKTGRWVVDGEAGPAMEISVYGGFSFSADCTHFCYLLPQGSRDDGGVGIVVDGKLRATHPFV